MSDDQQFALTAQGAALLVLAGILALTYLFMAHGLPGWSAPWVKAAPLWILAILAMGAKNLPNRGLLALALAFSGLGDLLLSLGFAGNFAAGMGAFLLAQLCYIGIFWANRRALVDFSMATKTAMALVLLWALGLGLWLLPLAGALAPALMVYFAALVAMVLLALGSRAPAIAKVGAVLFLLSDSFIGIDRFADALPWRHLAVMGSYYLAQGLLFWGLINAAPPKTVK